VAMTVATFTMRPASRHRWLSTSTHIVVGSGAQRSEAKRGHLGVEALGELGDL
jgi:hypothetical protein